MAILLARNWWAVLLRGIAALLFGIAALIWPGLALSVLVFLFGAYAVVDGIFALASALGGGAQPNRGWLAFEGIISILAGIVAFVWPGITALALLYLIAAWAIVTGVVEIMSAIALRRQIEGELFLGLAGVASIIFGLLLVIFPSSGALAVIWLIGAYAIVFGLILIALALRLRGWRTNLGA